MLLDEILRDLFNDLTTYVDAHRDQNRPLDVGDKPLVYGLVAFAVASLIDDLHGIWEDVVAVNEFGAEKTPNLTRIIGDYDARRKANDG